MASNSQSRLEQRIVTVAEAALAHKKYVSPVDVLVGIQWLPQSTVDKWRQGRLPYLERGATANLNKLSTAMRFFRSWAVGRGLKPSQTAYVASTRDRRLLHFSASGRETIEQAYRTHWVSPALSDTKRARLAERQSRSPDLVVISPLQDWTCSLCAGTGDLLLMEGTGPVCLACADMDHLVFLGSGNATLTRRAKKSSRLSAVVVRWSPVRKRYERQGMLVEESGLARAEAECLADQGIRAQRRLRATVRRTEQDLEFEVQLTQEISRLYPGCPSERARAIAHHAGARGSGRVGRSAAGRALDAAAVILAVAASVRHEDTTYDNLLMSGVPRTEARDRVLSDVDRILNGWRSP